MCLLALSCYGQLLETRGMWTQIGSEKSGLRTPAHICQRIHIIAHQLDTLDGFAYAILNKITKTNFGGKVPGDGIGVEPGKLDDLDVWLNQQR